MSLASVVSGSFDLVGLLPGFVLCGFWLSFLFSDSVGSWHLWILGFLGFCSHCFSLDSILRCLWHEACLGKVYVLGNSDDSLSF